MFRRSTKITSLLVAAAAVVSLAPATGVSAATRLGIKEGTIESSIAFDGGKYLFTGYKGEDDDSGLYYNDGDKDKLIDDIDADSIEMYGDKYAFVKDGSDEYLIDLTTGKVIDETREELAENANLKLKSSLKKTDRYGSITTASVYLDETNLLENNVYGDVWYSYSATPASDADTSDNTVEGKLYGYANKSGKYVDVCNTANIYAYSSEKGKMVKVSQFNDAKSDSKLEVQLKNAPKYLTQDKDYIYQIVDVNIIDSKGQTLEEINKAIKEAEVKVTEAQKEVDRYAKIGATEKQALEAAKTNLASAKAEYEKAKAELEAIAEGEDKTAAEAALTEAKKAYDGTVVDAPTGSAVDAVATATTTYEKAIEGFEDYILAANKTLEDAKKELEDLNAQIKDGNLVSTSTTKTAKYIQKISKAQGDKEEDAYLPKSVESYEISSDYDSDDADDAVDTIASADKFRVINGVVYATTIKSDEVTVTTLKLKKDKVKLDDTSVTDSKLDAYLVEQDVEESQDIASENAVSIDVDGHTWALNKGTIYKFDGKDFKDIYTTDRALDTLVVYNEKSLMAWEDGNDVYTNVQEGEDVTEGEGVKPDVKTGWDKNEDGTWNLYDVTGAKVTGWANVGGNWYYMDKSTAVMQTGWINDNGTWYFCNESGAMKTGWLQQGSTWFYLQASGAMKTGWLNDNGTWYFLQSNGAMQTGWSQQGSTWFYLQSNGAMKTGWLNDNGTWYYLNANGAMAANTTVNGYVLGSNGAWIR